MGRRKLEINRKHRPYKELEALYKECNDATLQLKLLAILQTWDGKPSTEVAQNIHKSDYFVRKWVHKYNKLGVEGLKDSRHGNRISYLSESQKQAVIEALQKSPRDCGFNRSNWSMSMLKKWISDQWGINYKVSSLYDVIHSLGFTLQRSKKQSRNANPERQVQFKSELQDLLHRSDADTVVLYEDEAIFTDEPTITAKWSRKGKQPIIPTDSSGSRERTVMFGAVNPKDGKVHYSTSDAGNSDSFEDFLK